MILLDGKKLAEKILGELHQETMHFKKALRLAVVVVGRNPITEKFIEQKNKTAASSGIDVRRYDFGETISTNELRKHLAEIVHEEKNSGVIVQLPLPAQINTQYILNAITPDKDVDVLSARVFGDFSVGKSEILPPVVGAIQELFDEYAVDWREKYAVMVGAGRLVGKPVATWLINEGVTVSVINEHTKDIGEFTKRADIIVSGAGKPRLITGDLIKDGAVIIDAGISESDDSPIEFGVKKIVGDVDFESVASRASYITPVPGGIGPLTVVMLFKNLITLAKTAKR